MVRLPRPGLRWKLVFALVATSGLTLLVAVLALLPPLRARLEHDRLHALEQVARQEDATLSALPRSTFTAGDAHLSAIAHRLARRTGARVAIFDAGGRVLADSDPGRARRAAGRQHEIDTALVRAGVARVALEDRDAVILRPEHVAPGRVTLVLRKNLNDTRAALSIVRSGLPLAAAIALTIALIAGILVSFRLLRRLERLRRGVRRMQDDGIDRGLPRDDSADEVGEVSRAVEALRDRLSHDERARQEFLSTASHEMRTPVASLQGNLELLEEVLDAGTVDITAARHRAKGAARQARRLAQLTEDLLDLSRLDVDLALRSDQIELGALAATVLTDYDERFGEAGTPALTGPRDGAWATGDAPAIARIIRIVLDNALQYAPGHLPELASSGDADATWLRVSDHGPGVAPGERERIFQRFERGSASAEAAGFGLGLAIARQLARRMGGDLTVENRPDGATFALRLPGAQPQS